MSLNSDILDYMEESEFSVTKTELAYYLGHPLEDVSNALIHLEVDGIVSGSDNAREYNIVGDEKPSQENVKKRETLHISSKAWRYADTVYRLIKAKGHGVTVDDIVRHLLRNGDGISKKRINSLLYDATKKKGYKKIVAKKVPRKSQGGVCYLWTISGSP